MHFETTILAKNTIKEIFDPKHGAKIINDNQENLTKNLHDHRDENLAKIWQESDKKSKERLLQSLCLSFFLFLLFRNGVSFLI